MFVRIIKTYPFLALLTLLISCSEKQTPVPDKDTEKVTGPMNSVLFLDPSNGFASGQNGVILYTHDGGDSWTHKNYSSKDLESSQGNPAFVGLHFLNKTMGWAYGTAYLNGGILCQTTNGGVDWDTLFTTRANGGEGFEIISDAFFTDASNGYMVVSKSYSSYTTGTYTFNEDDFLILSNANKLFKTGDGGKSWQAVQLPSGDYIYKIYFTDSQHGFVCGRNSMFLETKDGGSTWTNVSVPAFTSTDPVAFSDIVMSALGIGYVTTVQGSANTPGLLKTIDFGKTWSNIGINVLNTDSKNPVNGQYDIKTMSDLELIIYPVTTSSSGHLYRSIDGGNNWQEKKTDETPYIYSYNFIKPDSIMGIRNIHSAFDGFKKIGF